MPTKNMTPKSDTNNYPFLVKTLITFTKNNSQGREERHKDEVVFKLDRPSAAMPWYVLRNYSVPKFLTKKYGPFEVAWQRIYEIRILKLVNRVNPNDITDIPLRVMTLSQLEAYCGRWDLNVPVHEFYSVEKAREMVALRQQDEKGYEKHLREYREGKQRNYPELDQMRGDIDAAVADDAEFDLLQKKEKKATKLTRLSEPTAIVSDEEAGELFAEEAPPSVGDQPAATNPFSGV